jgi:urocanate hydratase
MASIRTHCEAIVALQDAGAVAVDYGNNLRGYAKDAGFENAFAYPGFVPAYIRDLFCEGKGPFRWAALSGDAADIHRTDEMIVQMDSHGARPGGVPGVALQDLLAGAGGPSPVWSGHQRSCSIR